MVNNVEFEMHYKLKSRKMELENVPFQLESNLYIFQQESKSRLGRILFHFVAVFIHSLNVNKLENIPPNYTLHNENHGWLLVNVIIYKSLL
jgi:hypothetical protein